MMGYDIRDRNNIGEISVNHPSHLVVTIDLSSATWNTVATHEVFTVTGLVRMQVWVVCPEDLTSGGAATLDIGFESQLPVWLADYSFDGANAGTVMDTNATAFVTFGTTTTNEVKDIVLYSLDVGYEIKVAALTNGTLEFHCIWQPLTAGATVVAGTGGTL